MNLFCFIKTIMKIFKRIKAKYFSKTYINAVLYSLKRLLFYKNDTLEKLIYKRTILKYFVGMLGENVYNLKIYKEFEKRYSKEDYFNFNGLKHPRVESKDIKGFVYDFLNIYYLPFFYTKCITDEGPYFYDKVSINNGDIVIDAGAHSGIFSALASSMGAVVYAFEPIINHPFYLIKTSELNPNIKIIPLALSNFNGYTEMIVDEQDSRASRLEFLKIKKRNYKKITVKATTLDNWVKENNIEKIDFIKTDIEGAERYFLEGSKWVLKNFSPKLSLSAYHFDDDEVVLPQLIKKINPNYIVICKWKKVFAWVDK